MANPISNLGTIPTLTIGGRVFTDLTNLKTLVLFTTGTNTGTFRVPGATSGYTPSASFALKVNAWKIIQSVGGAPPVNMLPVQSDNDTTVAAATAPTNPKYLMSQNAGGLLSIPNTLANSGVEYAVDFTVANTKYLSVMAGTAGYSHNIFAYGYEV